MGIYDENYYPSSARDYERMLKVNTITAFVDITSKSTNDNVVKPLNKLSKAAVQLPPAYENSTTGYYGLFTSLELPFSMRGGLSIYNNDFIVYNTTDISYEPLDTLFRSTNPTTGPFHNWIKRISNKYIYGVSNALPYVKGNDNINYLIVPLGGYRISPNSDQGDITGQSLGESITFPILKDLVRADPDAATPYFGGTGTVTTARVLLLKPGYIFETGIANVAGKSTYRLNAVIDSNYTSNITGPAKLTTKLVTNTLELKYTSDNKEDTVSLDKIYKDVVEACNNHYEVFMLSTKDPNTYPTLVIDQTKQGVLHINDLNPNTPMVKIVTDLKIVPGNKVKKLHYSNYTELNLDDSIEVSFDGGIVHRINSPYAMNLYVEVYQDGVIREDRKEELYFANTSSESIILKTGAVYKIAAWSLGKATYFKQDTVSSTTSTPVINIEWIDYERDVLNLNALVSVTPMMQNIQVNTTASGIELKLPELALNADEAKMILHLLSSTKPGLVATAKGGTTIVSRINTDRFSLFAPMFTVVKQDHLTNEQKVTIDLFIDDSIAIRQNPSYVPNPYRTNGRVELRSTPAELTKPEEVKEEPQIDVKSLAQETVELLMRHPQFLSASTMTLALDK